jgi:hypothetical protein
MARARLAAAAGAALLLLLLLAVMGAGAICDTNSLPTLKPVRRRTSVISRTRK